MFERLLDRLEAIEREFEEDQEAYIRKGWIEAFPDKTNEIFLVPDPENPLGIPELSHSFRLSVHGRCLGGLVKHSTVFLCELGIYFDVGGRWAERTCETIACNSSINRLMLSVLPIVESSERLKKERSRLANISLIAATGRSVQDPSEKMKEIDSELDRLHKASIELYHRLVSESELIHLPENPSEEAIKQSQDRALYLESLLDTFEKQEQD